MKEESWTSSHSDDEGKSRDGIVRRNHEGGIMHAEACRRNQWGGIKKEEWKPSGRHLEASGRHRQASGKHLGDVWRHQAAMGSI